MKASPSLKAKKGCTEKAFYAYNVVLLGNTGIVLEGQCQEQRVCTILHQRLFSQNILFAGLTGL